MADLRVNVRVEDDLRKLFEQDRGGAARAATRTMQRVAGGNKDDKRRQIRSAGLGNRLANTVRGEAYPKRGASMNAAAVVFAKASYLNVFADGEVIRSRNGFFLAIPTASAPKKGTGGKRITPSNFPEYRYGPLRFVYRKGGVSLLVVDNLRARGGQRDRFSRAGKRASAKGYTATVVMFVLVPQVTIRKRLDFDAVDRRWESRLRDIFMSEWKD